MFSCLPIIVGFTKAIQNVNLDKGGHLGHFNSQLAQENTWSGTYAAAVIVEYRRFYCCLV